jgi:hypothetical protein
MPQVLCTSLPFRKAAINIFRNLAGLSGYILIYQELPLLKMSTSKETDVVRNGVIAPSPAKGQCKILGQTKAHGKSTGYVQLHPLQMCKSDH